jgi:hypothetical protein
VPGDWVAILLIFLVLMATPAVLRCAPTRLRRYCTLSVLSAHRKWSTMQVGAAVRQSTTATHSAANEMQGATLSAQAAAIAAKDADIAAMDSDLRAAQVGDARDCDKFECTDLLSCRMPLQTSRGR